MLNQTVATLAGAGLAAIVALYALWHTMRANRRGRAVQALVAVYKDWYRQSESAKFRSRLATGDLKDVDLKAYATDPTLPDAQSLRDYLGWWEFIAILIRFGLIGMAEADAVFDTNPNVTLDKAVDYINYRRQTNNPRYARFLEEWVVLRNRRPAVRWVPAVLYPRRDARLAPIQRTTRPTSQTPVRRKSLASMFYGLVCGFTVTIAAIAFASNLAVPAAVLLAVAVVALALGILVSLRQ